MTELKEKIIKLNSNMRFLAKFVREVQRGKSFIDRDNAEVKKVFFNKQFVWKLNNTQRKITICTITDDRNDLLDGLYLGIHFLSYHHERLERILSIVESEMVNNPEDEDIVNTHTKLKRLVDDINDGL